MADVRVGVRAWDFDSPPEAGQRPRASVEQHWVSVDDVVITAEHGLIEVGYGVSEPGGFGEVWIRVGAASFGTSYDAAPAGAHDHDDQLAHLIDEWGTLGVLHKLLDNVDEDIRHDLLNRLR